MTEHPRSVDQWPVGTEERFERLIEERDLDEFARLSGDTSPLHMDASFAQQGGFRDRVVHGALLVSLVSRLIGMTLPGQGGLLLGLRLDFAKPTYPGETVEVIGTVAEHHAEPGVLVLRLLIRSQGETRARGSAMVQVRRG